jgi:hypothetical protein
VKSHFSRTDLPKRCFLTAFNSSRSETNNHVLVLAAELGTTRSTSNQRCLSINSPLRVRRLHVRVSLKPHATENNAEVEMKEKVQLQ